ncbi:hypothetical protein D3C87_1811330 [compost metagenome]
MFDAAPGAGVLRLVLRHHVGKRKALRHGVSGIHVAGGRHVAARVAGPFVVVQAGAFAAGQAGFGVELVGALQALRLRQQLAVQAFGDKHWRFGLAVVQDGKS